MLTGVKKSGKLLYADEEKLIVEESVDPKNKDAGLIQTEIPFLNIKSTTVVIKF